MRITYFHIDAFATKAFEGNQAAVMPLDAYMDDATLQAIAAENNFAETAFIVPQSQGVWALRWFTPTTEVPICGHATLAAAHTIYNHLGFDGEKITFDTRKSGQLFVSRLPDGRLEMDFPADPPHEAAIPDGLLEILGRSPVRFAASDIMMIAQFPSVSDVTSLTPDLARLTDIYSDSEGNRGILIVTALGDIANGAGAYDVVSRVFAPGVGIPEDPATGAAHCVIAPFIQSVSGQDELTCFQAYPGRGARIETALKGDRVILRGRSVTVVEGAFHT